MRDIAERVSIRDIARAAETSVSTVSRALNDHPDVAPETRDRILQIADQLGYERNMLAHSLISGRSGLIGVIVPDVDYDYQLQFLRGITHAAQRLDQEILLSVKTTAVETVEACWSMYRSGIADGVILFSPPAEEEEELRKLQDAGFPIVVFHPPQPLRSLTAVEPMDYEGGLMAVQHLLMMGHRRIGIIVETTERAVGHERLRGYKEALELAGIPYNADLVAVVPPNQPLISGQASVQRWLAAGTQFTALFCFNDLVAYGAIEELSKHDIRIPEQLSVIGFDDIPASRYFGIGGLTTIRQPITRIGELALENLLQLCDGKSVPGQRIQVPVELVVRGTSGPAPATILSPSA